MTVTVSQSLCPEDKANSFLLLPTRTHGYISTSVSTRDLADRIFLSGWNVAPTNHSSQNRSKPCLQTPLANLCSTLLWIYQDQQHMSTVHFACHTQLFLLPPPVCTQEQFSWTKPSINELSARGHNRRGPVQTESVNSGLALASIVKEDSCSIISPPLWNLHSGDGYDSHQKKLQ